MVKTSVFPVFYFLAIGNTSATLREVPGPGFRLYGSAQTVQAKTLPGQPSTRSGAIRLAPARREYRLLVLAADVPDESDEPGAEEEEGGGFRGGQNGIARPNSPRGVEERAEA